MTPIETTRPSAGVRPAASEAPTAPPEAGDELVEGGDPLACPACVAARSECEFHRGWAAGWDACTAFVAHSVQEQRAAELDPANWTPWLDDELDEDLGGAL